MIIPIGEYRPDLAGYKREHTSFIRNAIPRGDGYGPMPALEPLTTALAADCRGFFLGRNADGTVAAFAGTSTKLYKLDNTDLTWDDVSVGAGSYTALSASAQWSFAQFGLNIIAVQKNVAPQVFTLGSSSAFAALGGSPPQAAYVAVVFKFLVLSGLNSEPTGIEWSGLNAITTWDGTNQSGSQTFPDGGDVRGVSGGEYGIVFQESAVRHMTFLPNDTTAVFNFERIASDEGLYAPYSMTRAVGVTYYLSRKGFKAIAPGGLPQPIGAERVDRTFFNDVDETALHLIVGASDPENNRIYITRKSTGGASSLFDKVMIYDYLSNRWVEAEMSGQYIAQFSNPGLTLENLDTALGSNIDLLTGSFDEISTGDLPKLAVATSDDKISLLSGENLEAIIETGELTLENGIRMRVQGVRPFTDAPTVYASVGAHENLYAGHSYSTETAMNQFGVCPANVSTRHAHFRLRIPAGVDWTHVSGIEPEFAEEGRR